MGKIFLLTFLSDGCKAERFSIIQKLMVPKNLKLVRKVKFSGLPQTN